MADVCLFAILQMIILFSISNCQATRVAFAAQRGEERMRTRYK